MNALETNAKRRIAVVTGSRADFGLLRPVMRAIQAHRQLDLMTIAAGSHVLPPQRTIEEVYAEFEVAATVPMQTEGCSTRQADAAALGRGITGFAQVFAANAPDIVVVLGDRIEAFAAAAAASVAGIRVAHLHGGDRAEGIADEALRHAITKLAHIHLPATQTSALRIIAMGEEPQRVHIVGSPAIDGLHDIGPMSDGDYAALGSPLIVVLLHPVGDADEVEYERAAHLLAIAAEVGSTVVLHPNHDPGRDGIVRAVEQFQRERARHLVHVIPHLHREQFIALLRRVRVLVGNSSAGLIECAAIPVRAINIGRRQRGRDRPGHVVDVPEWVDQAIQSALRTALAAEPITADDIHHPYGDGAAGRRAANLLATLPLHEHSLFKRNTY